MPVGPGKYDAECMQVLTSTNAAFTAVIVISGDRGSGFSLACDSDDLHILAAIPELLREMATQIEASYADA